MAKFLRPVLRGATVVGRRASAIAVTRVDQRTSNGGERSKSTQSPDDISAGKWRVENEAKTEQLSTSSRVNLADATFRGVGQVIFIDSPYAGAALLGGLSLGDPYLATLALVGAGTSTAVANVSCLDSTVLRNGLWGYNGCLVGCAAAVFISPLPMNAPLVEASSIDAASAGLTATVFGAAAAPYVSASLKPLMGNVPQWTLGFNFITLGTLLRTGPIVTNGPTDDIDAKTLTDPLWMMEIPLKGISQIFVVESPLSGAVMLGAIAGLYSPGLALHATVGSTVGAATGYALGVPLQEIGVGLWGFNSALTSMGVGTFFTHSNKTMALSVGGAAATAVLFGAMKTVFGAFDAPCLTLPFCATMSGCYLLGASDAVPGLTLAKSPHSPEKN